MTDNSKNNIQIFDEDQFDDALKAKAHLAAYDLLKSHANWLEDPNNEIFSLLEYDNDSLNIAAKATVIASAILKKAALDIQLISGIEDTNKYSKDIIDKMAELKTLADEFDASGDEDLIKKASLLDEILITMASGVEEKEELERKFNKKIAEIKEKAKNGKNNKEIKVATEGNVKQAAKELRPLEAPLQSRYCASCHSGQLSRLRDDVWYCDVCSAQINYKEGYTTAKGNKVPGTDASEQTANLASPEIKVMFGY